MSQIFWLMNFIPDSIFVYVYYCLLALGITFYIASKLVSWIPFIKNYKFPVELVGVISLVSGAFLIGGYGVEMSWRQRVKDLEEKIKVAEEKSKEVNTVIQERIVYKTKVVEKKTVEYVDRIKEIAVEVDAKCEVDPRVIELMNNASQNPNEESK